MKSTVIMYLIFAAITIIAGLTLWIYRRLKQRIPPLRLLLFLSEDGRIFGRLTFAFAAMAFGTFIAPSDANYLMYLIFLLSIAVFAWSLFEMAIEISDIKFRLHAASSISKDHSIEEKIYHVHSSKLTAPGIAAATGGILTVLIYCMMFYY